VLHICDDFIPIDDSDDDNDDDLLINVDLGSILVILRYSVM
jgi:hypothetical protein